jgi:hypothetical protein
MGRTSSRFPETQEGHRSRLRGISQAAEKAWLGRNQSLDHQQAGTGTFPATFFLACIAALELDGVALEEI